MDRDGDTHVSLPRLQKGQVAAFAASVFVPGKYQKSGGHDYCVRTFRSLDALMGEHHDLLGSATSANDFARNWQDGRTALFYSIEGAWCFQANSHAIDEFYALGVRMIGLTWQGDHDFATSWVDRSRVGLTPLGRKAVERMNQLGIAVDVSHMSDRAVEDVLAIATAPVIASHSNARALCDVPRNLPDEHIRRIAATGGIVGVTFYPPHLREDGRATIDDVVRHVRHVREVAGIEAVALGSDFDGIEVGPEGLETAGELPNLRRALQAAGFTATEVAAVSGGNFLRALGQIEARAAFGHVPAGHGRGGRTL
jgi:membrane dipeptidase